MQKHDVIKELLETIRRESLTGLVDQNVSKLLGWIDSVGGSLEEIGTNEDELKQLMADGHASQAKTFLLIAREMKSKIHVGVAITMIKKHVAEAGISLADIGTSEEELEEMIRYPKTK